MHIPRPYLVARYALCWPLLLFGTLLASTASVSADEDADPLALVGGRIMTQTDMGEIEGDILIRDGKIEAVGTDVQLPEGVRRIDVRSMVVTPGLIDARSTLWLTPAAAREAASDGGLSVLDGVDPLAEDWQEVARQGVTAVSVQPAATGNLGGSSAVLRVAPAASVEELVIQPRVAAQAAIGTASNSRTSRDRYSQYDRIKKVLEAAKKYGEQWKAYEDYQKKKKAAEDSKQDKQKKADQEQEQKKESDEEKPEPAEDDKQEEKKESDKPDDDKGDDKKPDETTAKPAGSTSAKPPPKPTRDPTKDFLLKVLSREIPLRIEAHREDDIAHALKLADELKIRVVVEGASHPRASLQELVDRRTPLVLGPVLELETVPGYRNDRPDEWLTALTRDGGRWALATFGQQPRTSRLLRVQAAAAVAAGVDPARVLRAITIDAATILGVDDQLGSVAPSKLADLVVFAGDPLDPATAVRLVLSRGRIVHQSDVDPQPTLPKTEAKALAAPLPLVYAIKTQRLLGPDGGWKPATLVVNRGRIAAVTNDAEPDDDVRVFDLGATPVTPGLMVAHTDLGNAVLVDDRVDSNAANLRAADAYDPRSVQARKLLQAGFLRVALAPGSSSAVSGNVGLVRVGAEQPIRGSTRAVKFVLGASARNTERYPASLAGQVELVRQVLDGRLSATALYLPEPVRRELMTERQRRLAAVRNKRIVALFEASSAAEVRAALRLIERHELRGVLVGPAHLAPFIDDLKRLDLGVVVRPVQAGDYDRYLDEVVQASRAGVRIAFGSGSGESCRMTAALAVAAGMSRERALSALTGGAARLLGLRRADWRLIEDAPADFVVWNGSPLDLRCRPIAVVVDGKIAAAQPTAEID